MNLHRTPNQTHFLSDLLDLFASHNVHLSKHHSPADNAVYFSLVGGEVKNCTRSIRIPNISELCEKLLTLQTQDQSPNEEPTSEAQLDLIPKFDLSLIIPNVPPTQEQIKNLPFPPTTSELAEAIYPNTTFDTALPQPWVNQFRDHTNFNPIGLVVWGYPEGQNLGCPLPLTQEANKALQGISL